MQNIAITATYVGRSMSWSAFYSSEDWSVAPNDFCSENPFTINNFIRTLLLQVRDGVLLLSGVTLARYWLNG